MNKKKEIGKETRERQRQKKIRRYRVCVHKNLYEQPCTVHKSAFMTTEL